MKANMISHITRFCDFDPGGPGEPPKAILSANLAPEALYRPLRRNRKIPKTSYVRNHVSFHLRPVSSKNIENWRSFSILNVDIFEKKYFLDFGKSPISTPDFQNFIFWIKKYYPKDHYKTIVSGFGPAGCMWQRSELRIGEKWESHGSPPLNQRFFQND